MNRTFANISTLAAIGMLTACVGGCLMAPGSQITVNVFSSRMVCATGTNSVQQAIEGGAQVSSNSTTATIPLK